MHKLNVFVFFGEGKKINIKNLENVNFVCGIYVNVVVLFFFMGHRRAELTTLRRRFVQPESTYWLSGSTRTLTANYNVLLFQDFQIMRYLLGVFYRVQWVSARIVIKRYGVGYVSVLTTIFRLLVRPWETLFFSLSSAYLFFRFFVCVQKVIRFFFLSATTSIGKYAHHFFFFSPQRTGGSSFFYVLVYFFFPSFSLLFYSFFFFSTSLHFFFSYLYIFFFFFNQFVYSLVSIKQMRACGTRGIESAARVRRFLYESQKLSYSALSNYLLCTILQVRCFFLLISSQRVSTTLPVCNARVCAQMEMRIKIKAIRERVRKLIRGVMVRILNTAKWKVRFFRSLLWKVRWLLLCLFDFNKHKRANAYSNIVRIVRNWTLRAYVPLFVKVAKSEKKKQEYRKKREEERKKREEERKKRALEKKQKEKKSLSFNKYQPATHAVKHNNNVQLASSKTCTPIINIAAQGQEKKAPILQVALNNGTHTNIPRKYMPRRNLEEHDNSAHPDRSVRNRYNRKKLAQG